VSTARSCSTRILQRIRPRPRISRIGLVDAMQDASPRRPARRAALPLPARVLGDVPGAGEALAVLPHGSATTPTGFTGTATARTATRPRSRCFDEWWAGQRRPRRSTKEVLRWHARGT
jgi:hypothetical protein